MSTAGTNLSSFNANDLPSAAAYKFAIVVAEWNSEVTNALYEAAKNTLLQCNAKAEHIDDYKVPGSFELTTGASLAAATGKYDAVICLGCVVQGETRHFEFICNAVANGLTTVSINYNLPVIFGVLTTDTLQQAKDRSGGKHGNKGIEAAVTALKMAILKKMI